ncbi:hypothetical protein BH24ACT13_BH24ACT13_16480 [soil metagenome]
MEIISLVSLCNQLESLGVEPPGEARRVLDVHAALMAAAAQSPSGDLRKALADGTLTAASAPKLLQNAARNENARQSAHALARDLNHPVRSIVREAFAADADRIVAELRPAFDAASAGVQRAAALLAPDAGPAEVLAAGRDTTEPWQQLAEHCAVLDLIQGARSALYAISGGQPSPLVAAYIEAAPDAEALDRAARLFDGSGEGLTGPLPRTVGGRWHRLISAGYTLRLNSGQEARQVIAAARAATASAAAAADAARARRGPRRPDWSLTLPQPR